MKSLKSLYLRNLMADLWRKKIAILCFMVVCAAGLGFFRYKKGNPEVFLSEEEQTELEEYNTKIEEYDTAIQEIKESLKLAQTQAEEEQRYVDNSVYMKLDSQNIQMAAAQYAVESGGNVGNILSSLVFYINEGGLKTALSEEYGDMDVEYWREIVICGTSGNVLNLMVMHYDAEQATTNFYVDLDGEDSSTNVISRSVAKDSSEQIFYSHINGNNKCAGHSECDAIIMDNAVVRAIPEITANNIDASLIHEAAIGKIAGEQLIKLMTLGLTEAQAEEQIVNGFLK